MRILFTGGGTGGHIFPLIAIIREMKKVYPSKDLDLIYMGPKDNFVGLLEQEGIRIKIILAGKMRRYFSLMNVVDILFKIPLGIIQSFFHIVFLSPDLIFCKGGYGALPVVIAGWLWRVPIILHESDITPGLANRVLSRFSMENFVSFPETEYFDAKKRVVVGNPIREEVLEGSKENAQDVFNLKGEKPVVLILGGSQGAQRINTTVLNILEDFLEKAEVIHQCGDKNYREIKTEVDARLNQEQKSLYHLFPFIREQELKHAYQAADLVVARAGSGLIFEIAALGKPSILVPLGGAAQNHQVKNAYAFAGKERAIVVEETNLTPHFFLEKVRYLLASPNRLQALSQNAREWSRPRAAHIIAQYIKEYLS